MENRKYLDKVIGSLVRGTKIDYDEEEIHTHFIVFSNFSISLPNSFTKYCKNIYGLTVDEVEYVWKQYEEIILDKIENGE